MRNTEQRRRRPSDDELRTDPRARDYIENRGYGDERYAERGLRRDPELDEDRRRFQDEYANRFGGEASLGGAQQERDDAHRAADRYSQTERATGPRGHDPLYGEPRSRGAAADDERDGDEHRYYQAHYRRSSTPFRYRGGSGNLFMESRALTGPHTGRGPKGYKRSDQQICEDACERLERDGDVDASDIEVTVEDAVIRLKGTVEDRQTKRRAEECVESVYGARDVMNELRIAAGAARAEGSIAARERDASADTSPKSRRGRK
jgi:hypothetical protein